MANPKSLYDKVIEVYERIRDKIAVKADKSYVDAKSSIKSPDGDTVVSADNDGTAKIAKPVQETAWTVVLSAGATVLDTADLFGTETVPTPSGMLKQVMWRGTGTSGSAITVEQKVSTLITSWSFYYDVDPAGAYTTTTNNSTDPNPTSLTWSAVPSGVSLTATKGTATRIVSDTLAPSSHVPALSDVTPQMDGTASPGRAATAARSDHVHPAETEVLPPGYALPTSAFPVSLYGQSTSDPADIELFDAAAGSGYVSWLDPSYGEVIAMKMSWQGEADSAAAAFNKSSGAFISGDGALNFNGNSGVTGESPVLTTTGSTVIVRGVEVASRVANAKDGNLAALDRWGNLVDSHKKPSDFQPMLTFDATPTAGSQNPVTSEGIKNAIDAATPEDYAQVKAQVQANTGDIADIKAVVPSAATAQNPLVDTTTMNSSIATNTANFLGTYSYVTDLGFPRPSSAADVDNDAIATALGGLTFAQTPTDNDYVFVSINYTPTTDVDEFRRFKFNGTTGAWAYEYTLNNSSFTAAQWAAINSGITSGDVTKLAGIAAGAQVNVIEGVKVNGTALTPINKVVDVVAMPSTATGADIAVSGSDATKISAALAGKEDASNKVTSLTAQSTDTQYPSAKCVYDAIQGVDVKPTRIYNDDGTDALDDKGQLFKSSIPGASKFLVTKNGITSEWPFYRYQGEGNAFNGHSVYSYGTWYTDLVCYDPEDGVVGFTHYDSEHYRRNTYVWDVQVPKDLDPGTIGTVLFSGTLSGMQFGEDDFRDVAWAGRVPTVEPDPYARFAIEAMPTAWAASTTYTVGVCASYDGKAYRCKTEHTSGSTFDASKWDEIPVLSQKQDALSDAQLANIAAVPGKANNADVVHRTGDETIAGDKTFTGAVMVRGATGLSVEDLSVGAMVQFKQRGIEVYPADNPSYVLQYPAVAGVLALTAGTDHAGNLAALDANGNPTDSGKKAGDFQSTLSEQQLANIAAVSGAPAFDATHLYARGDPVVYDGTLYTFTTTHTGAWTGGDVSAVNALTLIQALQSGKLDSDGLTNSNGGYLSVAGLKTNSDVQFSSATLNEPMNSGAALTDFDILDSASPLGAAFAGKANRASDPTAGNLAALDDDGNPTDSQIPVANVAVKSDLRYSLVTKTITDGAVTLDDRADNYVDARTLGSSDSLDIDFPALVDEKSRDFVLAVECGANPPALSYAAFVTIMAEDASILTPEEGMNIYAFTEFKTNMFLASRKTVDTVVVNTPESADQMLLAMQKRGIDTTGITNFGGVATALGLSDTATPQDAVDAVMN